MKKMNPHLRLLALTVAVLTAACGDDGTSGPADVFVSPLRGDALASIGQNAILPALQRAVQEFGALEAALATYAGDPTSERRLEARAAWAAAMNAWQELEMMQVGPIAGMAASPGGQDLRDELYPWPSLSRCAVDQDTLGEQRSDAVAIRATSVDRRGLGALEYVLFEESGENSCSPLSPMNAEGTWDALTDLSQRRATHAHTMAVVLLELANEALNAWKADGGNFVQEFAEPTRSGALYGSAQEGLNAVSDAMFYLDKETKDMKLGAPAGITEAANPEARESRHANVSRDHIAANLRGFQRLFHGGAPDGDDLGFDDLLTDMGAGDFAGQMARHIQEAIDAVLAIEPTLIESLTANPALAEAAFAAIGLVTDDLKTMFLSVLDLEIPDRAAGDTD